MKKTKNKNKSVRSHFIIWLHPCVCYSINGNGAAEPVPDNLNEGEEENGGEQFSSSWPTAFNSTPPDAEESHASKQVQEI